VDEVGAVTVAVGLTMVVVWPMLTEWVGPDDVLKERPPTTSTTITTMAATTSAMAPAIAQPRPCDRWSLTVISSSAGGRRAATRDSQHPDQANPGADSPGPRLSPGTGLGPAAWH
jgi:hypothetical protein